MPFAIEHRFITLILQQLGKRYTQKNNIMPLMFIDEPFFPLMQHHGETPLLTNDTMIEFITLLA